MRTFLYQRNASLGLLRKTCAASVWLLLSAAILNCSAASEAYVPLPPSQPIPMDATTYAWIGRQALAQYGYEEIIQRAVDAGVLYYPTEQTNTQNLVGQTMADAGRQARPVFTEWAVTAAFTSQLDSPGPGPMDVVAIGMLVVGLGSAVFVGVRVLTSSTTATATATATPVPTAKPTTTTTAPPIPIALPRRYPGQTCENTRLDELQTAMKAVCKGFPGKSCSDKGKNAPFLPVYPCSLIKARIPAVLVCIAARQKVQDECFKNAPEAGHEQQIDDLTKGIILCEALKVVNCAPSHPMSGL